MYLWSHFILIVVIIEVKYNHVNFLKEITMNIQIKTILSAFLFSAITNCYATTFLTEDQVRDAQCLASQTIRFEDFRTHQHTLEQSTRKPWLTLVPFEFEYKGEKKKLCMAQGDHLRSYGEIAVYAGDVNPTKIDYSIIGFSDLGKAAPFLSYLQYEFIPAQNAYPAHFILEKVQAGYQGEGQGYSQAAVKYFIDEFVTKRTNVKYVFSDLRNPICQHYFPKYGFQKGLIEEFEKIKFERPMRYPYSWIKM